MMGATSGTGAACSFGAPEFTSVFMGFVLLNLLFSVSCYVDHSFSFCSFLFCSLYCVSFDNLRCPITPLVSSNFSHNIMLYRAQLRN